MLPYTADTPPVYSTAPLELKYMHIQMYYNYSQ